MFDRLNLILDGEACIFIADLSWRSIVLDVLDKDKDGYITAEEAQAPILVNLLNYSQASQIEVFDSRKFIIGGVYSPNEMTNVREIYYGPFSALSYIMLSQAFRNLQKLEVFDTGPHVTRIGDAVFQGCISLHNVLLGHALQSIGTSAFQMCSSLTNITLPDGVITIGGSCFQDSGLQTVTIGRSVTAIKWNAFRNCTFLKSFYIKATTPPTIEATNGGIFRDCPCTIYVPRASVDAYKAATNWSAYASRIYGYDF